MGVGYWPQNVDRVNTIETFLRAFGTLGYTLCFDGVLESGVEKIAIYGKGTPGSEAPTHAARQLEQGGWTSKLGDFEDINHATVADVEGPVYGQVICYLARRRV